jgi:NAD(P) transhydrogenase
VSDLQKFDFVIIGGGPAGIVAAATAKQARKSVALVDVQRGLGGAGVNTGTVPSKTLRETALAIAGTRARNLLGVDLRLKQEATVGDFLRHEQDVKAGFSVMISEQLKAGKTALFCGIGSFVDPHTVRVQPASPPPGAGPAKEMECQPDALLQGETIIVATGSSPHRPPTFPFGSPSVHDSDSILRLERLPQVLAVVGAGVIGCEYACTFQALGAKVHIVDGRDVLLPFLDGEMSTALAKAMERTGIEFHWKEQVLECLARGAAGIRLNLSSKKSLNVDTVLVAAGRVSNVKVLNVEAAGIKVGERGVIPVDEQFRTNVPHIFAVGDVIGFPALASTSMEQARRAVSHAVGLLVREGISPVLPNGIYTIPEVSMVGETEEQLRKQGVEYIVGRASYKANARGRIIGDLDGFLKLLFRKSDMKLLGVHIIGETATEIVHIGLMAMLTESRSDIFFDACFNVPTLGSLYKSATVDAYLQLSGEGDALAALEEI